MKPYFKLAYSWLLYEERKSTNTFPFRLFRLLFPLYIEWSTGLKTLAEQPPLLASLVLFLLVVSSTFSSSFSSTTPFLHASTLFFFNEIVPLPGQMIDWQGSQPHWKYNNGWRSGRGGGRKETLTDRQYASTNPLPTRPATVVALRSHPDDCVRSPSNEYFIYHVFLSFSAWDSLPLCMCVYISVGASFFLSFFWASENLSYHKLLV